MTACGSRHLPRQVPNPFTAAAIASVTTDGPAPITTPTAAVRSARNEFQRYLDRVSSSSEVSRAEAVSRPAEGVVLGITGDYGSGKTHLCVDLVRRALRTEGATTTTVYLPVTAASFVELYQQLLDKFKQSEIVAQVQLYYADVVESLLFRSALTRDLAQHVHDPETDVPSLVRNCRLPESEILQEVRSRLSAVTAQPDFATALTLLLRPGFDQAAWEWLGGRKPAEVLQERGIHETIDTEQRALEAIGVIALLHGRPGHGFVLVLDEFQQVLHAIRRDSDAEKHRSTTMAAFRTLLSTCLKAGTMLVVAGVPDILHELETDVRERITPVIEVRSLTEADLVDFLGQSLETFGQGTGIEPFTSEAVESLLRITDGSIRKVIQLCHHSFRRFQDDPAPIDARVVQEVAHDHLGQPSVLQVRDRIGQILDARGWSYLPQQRVGEDTDSVIDGWVKLRRSDRHCGILVADVLTGAEDLLRLRRRVESVRRERPGDHLILVVNRYMSTTFEERVRSELDLAPLRYVTRPSFETDLITRLEHLQELVTGQDRGEPLDVVEDRIVRLDTRQIRIHDSVENMADRLEELVSDLHRQRSLIQQLASGPPPMSGGLDSSEGPASVHLPRDVGVLFHDALETLDDLQQLDRVFVSVFDSARNSPDGRSTLTVGVRRVLRSDRTGKALSVGLQLRSLVRNYQNAVGNWWNSQNNPEQDQHRLRALCRAYEAVYEYLPVNRLSDLAELAEAVDGPAARRRTTRTIDRLTTSLYELATRVEQAALAAGPAS